LWIASQEGHTQIVQALLALGANIEAQDPSDGRTALFQAAQEGHADVVQLLLEHGAVFRFLRL
jgi:ankyrin repeat protein